MSFALRQYRCPTTENLGALFSVLPLSSRSGIPIMRGKPAVVGALRRMKACEDWMTYSELTKGV